MNHETLPNPGHGVLCKMLLMVALCVSDPGTVPCPAAASSDREPIFVSVSGNDGWVGSKDRPFATLERARAAVRAVDRAEGKPIEVILRGGTYYLSAPLALDPSDSGTETSPVVYRAAKGETVILSGGVRLKLEWSSSNGVYSARVPEAIARDLDIDQLFVNGDRYNLARFPNYESAEKTATQSGRAGDEATPGVRFPVFGGTSAEALSAERLKGWSDPVGAFVHALHEARWGSKHYRVVGLDPSGNPRLQGGWQENRGGGFDPFFRGGYHKELLYIENIREELDAPGEFFFDRVHRTLLLVPRPLVDPTDAEIVTPRLKELVLLRGDSTNPIRHVRLEGLRFRHTARVFLEPYERLLRGDWSVARLAAVRLEGAEACVIADSEFGALGGNGVFLSRYNRDHRISGNHFSDLCESAVCIVGDMGAVRSPAVEYRNTVPQQEIDLTPGPQSPNYPARCLVEGNLIHDLGLVGKQTAGVLISMSEEITVRHNTIFRIPRAAICINDGTWGGHLIEFNDAFNTVRETGDHGPFNSWGRDRHWETPGRFGISSDPVRARARSRLDNYNPTRIQNNRFAHPGGHSWGIDLDDGSSNYEVRNNLCLGMGIKLREGFFRTVENNIIIQGFGGFHVWYPGCDDVIRRNIFVSNEPYQFIRANPAFAQEFDFNLFWNDGAEPVVTGVGDPMTLSQWRSRGFDLHSLVANPEFVDSANGDYSVRKESPALKLGFRNFPMDQFGVRKAAFQEIARNQPRRFAAAPAASDATRDPASRQWSGATLKNLTGAGEQSATGMASETGVLVLSVPSGSVAAEAGFRVNDVILEIDGTSVITLETWFTRWNQVPSGATVSVAVFRGQQKTTLSFAK
jgi:hypothetical protein